MPRPDRTLSAAAAVLGRRGGLANTPAQIAARKRNAQHAGRKPSYRLTGDVLERRDGDRWLTLQPPYDGPAKAFLRRQRHR